MKTSNSNKTSAIPRWQVRLFWISLLLLVWEVSVKVFHVSPQLFPPVEMVVGTLWNSLIHGDLFYQLGFSVGIILLGMIIAFLVGLILAFLSLYSKIVSSFIETLTAIAHPLPGLALLPLIILWFGTGVGAILVLIVHSALWPILINLSAGIATIPQVMIDCARNLSMSRVSIAVEVFPRAAASSLLSGMRIAWARAWRALISAEMVFGAVGAKGGIGWYILKQRTFMNTSGLFAGIIVVVMLGLLIEDGLFNYLEKNTIRKWGMYSDHGK